MRCFIAIDLPDEIKKELNKIQDLLPESESKLVEPKNMHLTLIFLGELTDFQVNQCKELLKKHSFKRFTASTGKLGVFPSEKFIRVVWISLEPPNTFRELHDNIFESFKNLNTSIDKRFEPHVTLSRIKFVQDKTKFINTLKEIKPKQLEFNVKSIALKKSTLTRQGPIYEDIFNLELS